MTDLSDHFRVRVISLPERDDRRRELRRQFERNGCDFDRVEVFDAVRPRDDAGFPTVGAHGAFLSHSAVLREHIGRERPLLVCEDDLDLSLDFRSRIDGVLAALDTKPWDIFFFGAHLCGQPMADLAVRDPSAKLSHLHMAAYRPSVLPRLVAYLEAVRAREPGHPRGPMHVDDAIAFFRADNPDVVTRVAVPPLGHQRASPSDIQIRGWHDRVPGVRLLARPLRSVKNWLRRTGLVRHKPTA